MVDKECSMGGFNLRKCPSAGNKRPRVKRTTKPKPRAEDAPKSTRSGRRYGGEGLVYGTEPVGGMAKRLSDKERGRLELIYGPEKPAGGTTYMPLTDEQKQRIEHYRETHPNKFPQPPPGSGSPMPTVPLGPMSDNQRSKLRNGHPVRVTLGTGASGECSCKMKEENIKKIMKKKGGAATIKLDEDEKRENKFCGTGIMKGSRGGPKHGGVQAPKGKGMHGGVAGLITLQDVKTGQATMEDYEKSKAAQERSAVALRMKRGDVTDSKVGDKRKRKTDASKMKPRVHTTRTMDKKKKATFGMEKPKLGSGITYGGAIGRQSSAGITNVGAGGNILGPMQASKAPQAGSQNWFFHTQFPPAMAHEIVDGRGIIY